MSVSPRELVRSLRRPPRIVIVFIDSHVFIELIEDDWLFDLKKYIFTRNCYWKLTPLTSWQLCKTDVM